MKRYTVEVTRSCIIEVEAESADQAIEMAYEEEAYSTYGASSAEVIEEA